MSRETNSEQHAKNEETKEDAFHIDESNDTDEVHIMNEDSIPEHPLSEVDVLKEQLEKAREEVAENYQQFLRARADLENYRRRSRKEMEEMTKYASLPLVEALLPVLDNFERALEVADQSQSFYEGVEMVFRQLQSALQDAGLTRIEAKGEMFDPHQHNAVMQEENSEIESNTVLDELQSGYRFIDRVVRPSMVKISK